jgi:hypothetical protein
MSSVLTHQAKVSKLRLGSRYYVGVGCNSQVYYNKVSCPLGILLLDAVVPRNMDINESPESSI